jgi:hypothetical protein
MGGYATGESAGVLYRGQHHRWHPRLLIEQQRNPDRMMV